MIGIAFTFEVNETYSEFLLFYKNKLGIFKRQIQNQSNIDASVATLENSLEIVVKKITFFFV